MYICYSVFSKEPTRGSKIPYYSRHAFHKYPSCKDLKFSLLRSLCSIHCLPPLLVNVTMLWLCFLLEEYDGRTIRYYSDCKTVSSCCLVLKLIRQVFNHSFLPDWGRYQTDISYQFSDSMKMFIVRHCELTIIIKLVRNEIQWKILNYAP